MKYKELKEKRDEELNSLVIELKQELAKEKAKTVSGTKAEKPGRVKKLRRDVARVLTEITTRKGVVD